MSASLLRPVMRALLLGVLLAALASVRESAADEKLTVLSIGGAGPASCDTWRKSGRDDVQFFQWITGNWDGLNLGIAAAAKADTPVGRVGHSTDANGVVAEVWAECLKRGPSYRVSTAAWDVYRRLEAEGR